MKLLTLSCEMQPEVIKPAKKRKVDAINVDELDTTNSFSLMPWLTCDNMKMMMIDKCIITSGDLLSDKHIDLAQALLKKHHKELTILNSTLLLAKDRNLTSLVPSLQIFHTTGNHKIIATTLVDLIGSPKVFDSLYESIDLPTHNLLCSLYGSVVNIKDEPSSYM